MLTSNLYELNFHFEVHFMLNLGLAVTHSLTNNSSDIGNSSGVGTKQYLPLELLDDSIFVVDFVYKHIGMWAFDLVLWMITKRTFKMLNPKRNKRKRKLLHGFFLVP